MKRQSIIQSFGILALLLVGTPESLACRYNVRETGFVDFGLGSYRLLCFPGSDLPADAVSRFESRAVDLLAASLVRFELVSAETIQDLTPPAVRGSDNVSTGPSATLLSPRGNSLQLGPLRDFPDSLKALDHAVMEVASSSIRSRIAAELATAFGVVLLIEGGHENKNDHAREAILQAIESVEAELEYFPKPIKRGPVLVTLTPTELLADRVLLWSLQLSSNELTQPIAFVLYGRGRWIGPAMAGPEITLDLVSRILFLVGADCECGLDPRLLRGTGIPLPWSRSVRSLVSHDLGFDPDNPLVRMEIAQIFRVANMRRSTIDLVEDAYAESTSAPGQRSGAANDNLALDRLYYLLGAISVLVLLAGAALLIQARRQNR